MEKLNKSMVLDGICASTALDTSAEELSVEGCDISDLENGLGYINYEHRSGKDAGASANDIIGSIIFAKKILKEEDCKTPREKMYWDQVELPFIYIKAELFNDEGHPGAQAAAALVRYYNRRKLPLLARWSIEGSTIEREGNVLKRTISKGAALTLRPANRSCISGVISDSEDEEQSKDAAKDLFRFENPMYQKLSSHEMEIEPVIDDPVAKMQEALETLKEISALQKAISAGSYNAAPSSLSGGSALMAEEMDSGNKKYLKAQVLAAARDFRGQKGSFKDFLKSKLPDVSDSFVDYFANLVDEVHLKKARDLYSNLNRVMKGEKEPVPAKPQEEIVFKMNLLSQKLFKAAQAINQLPELPAVQPPPGSKKFKGNHVSPGEVEVISGSFKGSKLPLLGQDNYNFYVGDNETGEVKSLPYHTLGKTFKVNRYHQPIPVPNFVHGELHSDPLNTDINQKMLVHGIDLNNMHEAHKGVGDAEGITHQQNPNSVGWYKSLNGNIGFVKPSSALGLPWPGQQELPFARRETAYHNMARNFFGMGQHVPNTATFKHPDTGEHMSVMERVPEASHHDYSNKGHNDALRALKGNGTLDKLALMDYLMGSRDRHSGNYLFSGNNLHHIDNGLTFHYGRSLLPDYIKDYHDKLMGKYFEDASKTEIHPAALQWLQMLDSNKFGQHLAANGVPKELISHAIGRLNDAKAAAPTAKRYHDIWNQYLWNETAATNHGVAQSGRTQSGGTT